MEPQKSLIGLSYFIVFVLFGKVVSEQPYLEDGGPGVYFHILKDEADFMQIKDLPFAKILIDPCTVSYYKPLPNEMEKVFNILGEQLQQSNSTVQEVLKNYAVEFCGTMVLPDLPYATTHARLKKMKIEDALKTMYLSILVHSAYSYLVYRDSLSPNYRTCWGSVDDDHKLAEMSYNASTQLKNAACTLYYIMRHLGCMNHKVAHIIPTDYITFECSRRQIRICQIMKSTERLLQEVEKYAEDQNSQCF